MATPAGFAGKSTPVRITAMAVLSNEPKLPHPQRRCVLMADGDYVMPKAKGTGARVHYAAPTATQDAPVPLCNASADDADTFRVADATDRDRHGLCRVCAARANGDPDPRGNHGKSGRTPADVLQEHGFDAPDNSDGESA